MEALVRHQGLVVPIDRPNIDTDAIIPKQFLKRIERTGFGQFLFFDWRFQDDGSANPDFTLNQPRYRGASVLLTRANFGCGSSREHAPWALGDFGIKVIIAPSFADIFYNNCFKNGMLPLRLTEAQIDDLFRRVESQSGYSVVIDLERGTVQGIDGFEAHFEVEPFRRHCLMHGLDDIGLTLQHEEAISEYEKRLGV
jgi:3-isopropylmalate/(R)-2-methylmalate dehydratase small subunit